VQRATVTAKGQITIPVQVRTAMGLTPGSKVVFFKSGEGVFIVRRMGSIEDLYGCLAGYGIEAPKTNRALNELMAYHAAELDDAIKSGAQKHTDGEAA
jgi:antitoxin PrlF